MNNRPEYEVSLTEWVQGLGKGLILAPDYNLNLTSTGGACSGDCSGCNLCNGGE